MTRQHHALLCEDKEMKIEPRPRGNTADRALTEDQYLGYLKNLQTQQQKIH